MTLTVGDVKAHVAAIDKALSDGDSLKAKVEASFAELDQDKSGYLDTSEAKKLVSDLCMIMNLPLPNDSEFAAHFSALDANADGKLSVTEMGSGIVGAMQFKKATFLHYLEFATRDNCADTDPLPEK